MDDFAELGLEGLNKTTDKLFDKTYDKLHKHRSRSKPRTTKTMNTGRDYQDGYSSDSDSSYDDRQRRRDRNDKHESRDTRPMQRYHSPPGQSYYPRPQEELPYQPYRTLGAVPRDQSQPQYRESMPRASSRAYTPSAAGDRDRTMAPYTLPPYSRTPSKSRSRSARRRRDHTAQTPSPPLPSKRPSSNPQPNTSNPLTALSTTPQGLSAALAGALIGTYLGHELNDSRRHKKRAAALGAVIGGLGANLLESRVRIYREDLREERRVAGERWEERHGSQGRRRRGSRGRRE